MAENIAFLQFQHIVKTYPGVTALDDVSFNVKCGKGHCLLGENGAGKSTPIKILAGAEQPDSGEILLNGESVGRIANPQQAQELGLSFIHQELNVIEQLTVGDNFTLGHEQTGFLGTLRKKADAEIAQHHLHLLGMDIDPSTPMNKLSVAEKQMVEIARALAVEASVIIRDEPSAPLTEHELVRLFQIIEQLTTEQNVTIIYVSHILSEVFQIGDDYTVLRDGEHISTGDIADINAQKLISMMVGRELKQNIIRTPVETGPVVLDVSGIGLESCLQDITFSLHAGEIIGVAGLAGNGKSELAAVLFGKYPPDTGHLTYQGQTIIPRSPRMTIRRGVGLIPEERRTQGIVGAMSVAENIALASPRKYSAYGVVNRSQLQGLADDFVRQLSIKTPNIDQKMRNLSGGNQQKCVVARWLASDSQILILEEPTRGIDVGAKAEVYAIMDKLAQQGVAQLMFSSEMDELLGLCDRILVMHRGRIVADLPRDSATQELIMTFAAGGEAAGVDAANQGHTSD